MDRITNTHVYFWGSVFSNWHMCKFTFEGQEFENSEQAFMWCKAKHFIDEEIAEEILNTPDPRANKALGRKVKNFNDEAWAIHSFSYMIGVNRAKFEQNEDLKEILMSTDSKTLVEASPHDRIWGIGLHYNDDDVLVESKWRGMNLLGRALMQVRGFIRKDQMINENNSEA